MNKKIDDFDELDNELPDYGNIGDEDDWEKELSDDEDDEDDDVPQKKNTNSSKKITASRDDDEDEDVEEESDDDSDKKSDSFLATRNGKIFAVAGIVGLGILGASGYSFAVKHGLIGSSGEEPTASIPEQVAPPVSPVDEPEVITAPPVKTKAVITEKANSNLSAESAKSLDAKNNVLSPDTGDKAEFVKSETSPLDEKAFVNKEEKQLASIDENQIKAIVTGVIKEQNSKLADENNEIKKQLVAVNSQLTAVKTSFGAQIRVIRQQALAEAAKAKEDADAKRKAEQEAVVITQQKQKKEQDDLLSKVKSERQKLAGFQVVNTTNDGQMSVVKAPGDHIYVYFKGEGIRINGIGAQKVTGIENNGKLILISDKWYIDDAEIVAPQEVTKPDLKQKADEKEQVVQKTKRYRVTRQSDRQMQAVKKTTTKSAKGWKLNASFGDGYLIQSPLGEWKTVQPGETVSGLGVVEGVDNNGNLQIGGKTIIKSDE
jgi:hypothetical protein